MENGLKDGEWARVEAEIIFVFFYPEATPAKGRMFGGLYWLSGLFPTPFIKALLKQKFQSILSPISSPTRPKLFPPLEVGEWRDGPTH